MSLRGGSVECVFAGSCCRGWPGCCCCLTACTALALPGVQVGYERVAWKFFYFLLLYFLTLVCALLLFLARTSNPTSSARH